MKNRHIILASKSPRRREILENCGIEFSVITKETDESYTGSPLPNDLVSELSRRKLNAVLSEVGNDDIVVAADTIVWSNGKIFGKPHDRSEAIYMLKQMSGNIHEVYTGISVGTKEKTVTEYVSTKVEFRNLSDSEIEYYVDNFSVCDKAGAYAIQERAGMFVSRIDGDFFNIVGLPICRLAVILNRDFDYNL